MSKPIAAFRVDASRRIGGGHVMRCLTLAEALRREGFDCVFLSRRLDGAQFQRIEAAGHKLITLTPPAGAVAPEADAPPHAAWLEATQAQDAAECFEALSALGGAEWLITDHYALDARWHHEVMPQAYRILALDDLDDRPLGGDMLLNQSWLTGAPQRPAPEHQLIGPAYALLRPEFAALRAASLSRRAEPLPERPRVLICTGLMDVGGAALKTAEALAPLDIEIDVALASQADSAATLEALDAPNMRLHLDSQNIGALMRDADIAFGAAGATSWERLTMGLPSLVYVLADNQTEIAAALDVAGACRNLGAPSALDAEAIRSELHNLLSDQAALRTMSAKAAALCDGEGAAKVVQAMLTLHAPSGLTPAQ